MVKHTNKKIKGGLILFIVIILIAVFIVSLFSFSKSKTSGTVISLQQANFESSDSTIGGQAWLLQFIDNGGSQSAYGYFSTDEIQAENPTGEKPIYPLEITLTKSNQQCKYILYNSNQQIKRAEYIDKGIVILESTCSSSCSNSGYGSYFYQGALGIYSCACLRYTTTATVGSVSFDKLQFSTDINARINNVDYKGTISNAETQSLWLGEDKIHVSWYGNLVSGQDCPQPSGQSVSAMYLNGWKFIDTNRLNQYLAYDPNGLETCFNSASGNFITKVQNCINEYNELSDSATIIKTFKAIGGEEAISSGTTSNGQATINLNKQIQFPSFLMRVKASIMGIYISVGVPEIVSQSSECFQTGQDGFIVVTIKNKGTAKGTFIISADCPSPFEQSGTSLSVEFNAGQTKTVNIPITGQASEEVRKQCTINVKDLENPNNKDSSTVTSCVKPIVICTPNEERCNGNNKEKCNSVGSGWSLLTTNDPDCINNPPPITCDKIFGVIPTITSECVSWYSPFIWIVTILSGLAVFYLVFTMMKKRNEKEKGLNAIISIIFGLGAGFIVYIYWWAILIILGLFLIIKLVFKL